jgi:hypothetical protein
MDSRYIYADYALNSSASGISLQLNAVDTGSKVAIRHVDLPELALSDYSYVGVEVVGSGNAKIRMWFYLEDGSYFSFTYREDVGTVNARNFDLTAYAGRTLSGVAFIELMSSDGSTASMDITEIALEA